MFKTKKIKFRLLYYVEKHKEHIFFVNVVTFKRIGWMNGWIDGWMDEWMNE